MPAGLPGACASGARSAGGSVGGVGESVMVAGSPWPAYSTAGGDTSSRMVRMTASEVIPSASPSKLRITR